MLYYPSQLAITELLLQVVVIYIKNVRRVNTLSTKKQNQNFAKNSLTCLSFTVLLHITRFASYWEFSPEQIYPINCCSQYCHTFFRLNSQEQETKHWNRFICFEANYSANKDPNHTEMGPLLIFISKALEKGQQQSSQIVTFKFYRNNLNL